MVFIEITKSNIKYLNIFLDNTFPNTFRYFNNKTSEQIIKNHYKTLLYLENTHPIGYAHIDYDAINDKYWFGICVLSKHYRKGIGNKLITKILENFNNSNIDTLYLSVDKSNTIAYNLYIKSNFKIQREINNMYIMSLTKSNILYLPVSFGEAIDKLTILDIKMNKILDSRKIDIEQEYNLLYIKLKEIVKTIKFHYEVLKLINLQIWNDQDIFRYSINDNEKTTICIKIIEYNDARFRIKNKINSILHSFLKEQKGYNPTIFEITYPSLSDNYELFNSIIKYNSLFNDTVRVLCHPEQFNLLNNIFKYDITIKIDDSLTNNIESSCHNIQDYSYFRSPIFEFICNYK